MDAFLRKILDEIPLEELESIVKAKRKQQSKEDKAKSELKEVSYIEQKVREILPYRHPYYKDKKLWEQVTRKVRKL